MTKARDNATQGGLVLIASGTMTAASQLDFTGCFSSAYTNYKLSIYLTNASTDLYIGFRMLSGSTPDTSGNYLYGYTGYTYNGSSINTSGASTLGYILDSSSIEPDYAACEFTFMKPNLPYYTTFLGQLWTRTSNLIFSRSGGGSHAVKTAYDGLRLVTNTGNVTGVAKIYGIK